MDWKNFFNSFYPQDEDERRENTIRNYERGKRQMDSKILCAVILIIYLIINYYFF